MEIWFYILIVFVMFFLLAALVSMYENRHFVVNNYTLESDKLPESFDGFRAVVISDLHNQEFGEGNLRLLDAIRAQSPDIVICAGDILVGRPGADFSVASSLINALAAEYPVYIGMGNHEYRLQLYPDTYGDMWSRYAQSIANQDGHKTVHFLDNQTAYIEKNGQSLAITGLSIDRMYYKRFRRHEMSSVYVEKLCPFQDRAVFQILLAHNPDYFQAYADYGSDLVLSGHVHGGMIRLPLLGGVISPMLKLFPRYDKGVYKIKQSTMLLSAGLGNHTIRFRINNRPKLMVVTLNKTR